MHPVHVRVTTMIRKIPSTAGGRLTFPWLKHGGCIEEDLEEKNGKGGRTQGGHRGRLDPRREKDLYG